MERLKNYQLRLNIPISGSDIKLYDKYNQLVTNKYTRVVIGGRGPYVLITLDDINELILFLPYGSLWRLTSKLAYYELYRTNKSYVKVYFQLKTVNYADYIVGYMYISPFDLYKLNGLCIIN